MPEKLLNAERAFIDPRKLRDYVLNSRHAVGRYKAVFFAQMGYSYENWEVLLRDIKEQHLDYEAEEGQKSYYGSKYTITAPIQGPVGSARWVTTVWIYRSGQDWPELVAIQPASPKRE